MTQDDSGTTSDDSSDEVVCQCGRPNKVEPMIGCDSDDCPVKWYHFGCVNLTANTVPKDKWFCPRCE
ncbi:Inhibitor of growth protein 3 [Acropora cervicornis]|uniref:Inhibitor of growth protein 3 n=1 Tax=Acropora cervicornis TaxID=6130 RepID=A0AAD9UXI8_ACRCE|nr:Inhibitor of growth protein 3 [Acropora cervicornis]